MIKSDIEKMTFEEVEALLKLYLLKEKPSKLKFKPNIIEFNNDFVWFGMKKQYGRLRIDSKELYERYLLYMN